MRAWVRRLFRRRPRTLAPVDAYALWSASYPPHAHNLLMEVEQAAMARLMPPLSDRAVLDLACGTGRYGLIAQQNGARTVIGVDNSIPMLRAGALRWTAETPMTRLPFRSRSFDVILCGLAIGHLPTTAMRVAFAEMARVLRPGGAALLSDFHPYLAQHGGQRTFRAPDGTVYAVEHHPHQFTDYASAIRAAGLSITATDEPTAVVDGKTVPAVLVIRCER